MPFHVDMIHRLIETRPSVFDLSVSGSPPATSEGPAPGILIQKKNQAIFKRFAI